jgi:pimeloyl-ACP methyl ester carboxylesterase
MRSMFHADHRAGTVISRRPALVVHGAADTSAPVELTGRRTAQLVPGCRYVEYPTAGHGLFVTHAQQLNAELLELLKS